MAGTMHTVFSTEPLTTAIIEMTYQKPPDGGWGWVIVTISFFIQFLSYGSPLSSGVLYVEWLDVFDEGKGKTAGVGSMAAGFGLLASPLCSASVSSFGARPVVIFSFVLVAGGFILSSFAPNLYFLYFSYGFLVGFGGGLLYTASVTVTCQYFDKRRGFALGVISTGSSVGAFVYASLQRELISIYGLDGCLLIVGGLSLNILPCALLMRPLPHTSRPSLEKANSEKIPDSYLKYHEKDPHAEENVCMLEKLSSNEISRTSTATADKPQEINPNVNGFNALPSIQKDNYSNKVIEANSCKQLANNKSHCYMDYWEKTVDMFRNKMFSALLVAILLFAIGGFPPSLVLEDVAKSANIAEETMIVPLVSIIGFMMAIGKLLLGILADFKWVNALYLYIFTYLAAGVAVIAMPFANSYAALAVLAGTLGFLSGNWSIFPYVTTTTVGLEKLTHAYGILMFFAGAGSCLGPPIVGWFFDWTKTYRIAFYFCGACVLLGGLLLLIVTLPFCNKCRKMPEVASKNYIYRVTSSV